MIWHIWPLFAFAGVLVYTLARGLIGFVRDLREMWVLRRNGPYGP
jgi:hypothetical protein